MIDTINNTVSSFTVADSLKANNMYPFFRPISSSQGTVVQLKRKQLLMFGSNSYLGLTDHPLVKEAAKDAIDHYGTGCAGSMFLNGTLDIHIELERELAAFVGKEDAVLFPTGFQANLGTVSCLLKRRDYLVLDESNHASIIDGSRLSFSGKTKYLHNNTEDLDKKLQALPVEAGKLIVSDGVFSMEGDIVDLPSIVNIARKHQAAILIDDAHGLGVFGNGGRGTASHFGLTDSVDLIMGTFSKSLASIGGFVAGNTSIIDFIRHKARSLMFSASMPPAAVASTLAALQILRNEKQRVTDLWDNVNYTRALLKAEGYDIGGSVSPVIPVYTGSNEKTFLLTKILEENGVFVNPVVSPAVKEGDSLIRLSLMATHSTGQIDFLVEQLNNAFKQLDLKR